MPVQTCGVCKQPGAKDCKECKGSGAGPGMPCVWCNGYGAVCRSCR